MRFTLAWIFGLVAVSVGAMALPARGAKPWVTSGLAMPVRMVCDPQRCFDPRSGVYSSSTCDRRGCYQSGPIIGHLNPRQLRDLSQQHGVQRFDQGHHHGRHRDWDRDRRWRY